ncbi:MAG TPA: dynamin family protein [Actinomycetota bacterium]|nr:dynamin family protein [Actinomycetota bacterium]
MGERTCAALKSRLQEALGAIASLADERASSRIAEAARGLEKKLAEERFNVVVAGESKRRKTTFVNALLGAEVLPAAVVPLTSIVTIVGFAEKVRAEVLFRDGRTKEVPAEELSRYVTERGNPGNRLGVDRAALYFPAEDLRDGVFLADTPGVGSVYRHNTDAARAFLPEADAAIFLTSADPPISEGERSFLEEVRAEAARMFFVLNKVDYLSEPDREEAIAFTEQVLERALGKRVRVYPVSARHALEGKTAGRREAVEASGLEGFERDFRAFLLTEKGAAIVASVASQARKLLVDERNSLDVEELEGDLAAHRSRDTAALLGQIEAELAQAEDLKRTTAELGTRVEDAVRRAVDRWRVEEERRVAERFVEATARFVEETNRLVDRTVRLVGEVLQVKLQVAPPAAGLAPEARFTYSFFEVPTLLESLLPDVRGYLPKRMARKLLLKEVRERIPLLLDKHSGRLRWDFQQRLDRSRLALQRTLDERLEATIESLRLGVRRALEDQQRTERESLALRAHLAESRERLRDIEKALEAVMAEADAAREGVAA